MFYINLSQHVKVHEFREGFISMQLSEHLPKNFLYHLKAKIFERTGAYWTLELVEESQGISIFQQEEINEAAIKERFLTTPLMQKLLKRFPGITVERVN